MSIRNRKWWWMVDSPVCALDKSPSSILRRPERLGHILKPPAIPRRVVNPCRQEEGRKGTDASLARPPKMRLSPFMASLRVLRAAETDVLCGEARGDRGPLVDYAVRQRTLETAAADHIPGLRGGRWGLQNGGEAAHRLRARRLQIVHELPDVAGHVDGPERALGGGESGNPHRPGGHVIGHIRPARVGVVAPWIAAPVGAARGLLPFERGGKALACPLGEFLRVDESDPDHRVVRMIGGKARWERALLGLAEARICAVGNFGPVDVKGRQRFGMAVLPGQKWARGHQHHLAGFGFEHRGQFLFRVAVMGAGGFGDPLVTK